MPLPDLDTEYLKERGIDFEIIDESGMTCVVMPQFPLPSGFDREHADLLLRLPAGYPDLPPDMWWFDPAICRQDGQGIPATESIEQYLGRAWQRWSRHFAAGQWQSGIDGLESFIALIRRELQRSVPECVA